MDHITPFLKQLLSLPGLSAYEAPVREVIQEAWKPLVDDLTVSRLGSLHGLCRGKGTEPRPSILLAAHMDAIGLMVTQVVDGFLRFTEIGGIDPRILPGQPVTIHGRRDLPGIIAQPADRLLPPAKRGKPVSMDLLWVDTGLLPAEVAELVRPGDIISFANSPIEMGRDVIAGHSQDNRASVAAVTACLGELKHMQHVWDVWAVATAQEEETLGGGLTSPFEIRPTIAIAIDVTFAKGPGASDYRTFPLGTGPTIGWGPNNHVALFNAVKALAEKQDIPFHIEMMPRHSGTDAYGMQIVAEGIPTLVIGIPLRYMHTPVEMVSTRDIQRVGHLLAEFIASLDAEFVNQINWDEAHE